MRPPKYPLEPVAKLREQKAEDATRTLAVAVAARRKAEDARAGAEQRRASHDRKAAAVREAEREALGDGDLKVADLARAGAWEIAVVAEREQLDAAVTSTQGKEKAARDAEADARGKLTARRADVDAVEKDRARWREGVRRREEAKEEEAASEAWRPRQDRG